MRGIYGGPSGVRGVYGGVLAGPALRPAPWAVCGPWGSRHWAAVGGGQSAADRAFLLSYVCCAVY